MTWNGSRPVCLVDCLQKTKAELDNLKLGMELTTQRQIGEVVKEIRSVVSIIIRGREGARD